MDPITCLQLFSRRGLGYLWSIRSRLDPGQEKIINSIYNNKKKGLIEGKQSITYKLSGKKAGKLGYGRYYGSIGSLETLERECRGTLCKEYYHDIDIVNCHFVLLVQFARDKYKKSLPEVQYYIDNREEVLKLIGDNRDESKKEVIRILYGGRNEVATTKKLSEEVRKFSKFLSTQSEYSQLFSICEDEDNKYGTFLSFVLQTEERAVMLSMKEFLETNKWSVDVLAYDGVMIRRREGFTVDFEALQEHIFKNTNYRVEIVEKEMIGFEVPDTDEELVPGVSKSDYLAMKEEFEKTHFYYYPNNTYCEISGDVDRFFSEDHATMYFRNKYNFKISDRFGDYITFFVLWLKDTTKRTIKEISFIKSDDKEIYYKPLEFKYNKVPLLEDIDHSLKIINRFEYLIKINTNHKPTLTDYLTNYLAHLLQKPFELPGVAIIISGEKGYGKDTLIDFVGAHVVGEKYFYNYQTNKQFFDPYDTNRKDKFLIKLEEADRKYFLDDASALKSFITASRNTFNPKMQHAITVDNFLRYIFTANKSNVADMTQGERRFFLSYASGEKKGDFPFWNETRELLFNDTAGRVVAEYLLNRDISNFTPRVLPQNDYQEAVCEAQKSAEERFLESWDGEETLASDLYTLYVNYCENNRYQYIPNSLSFGHKLVPFIATGVIKKGRQNNGVAYSKN